MRVVDLMQQMKVVLLEQHHEDQLLPQVKSEHRYGMEKRVVVGKNKQDRVVVAAVKMPSFSCVLSFWIL